MTEKNKYQTNIWTQSQEKSSFGRQSLIMKNNHIHDKKYQNMPFQTTLIK